MAKKPGFEELAAAGRFDWRCPYCGGEGGAAAGLNLAASRGGGAGVALLRGLPCIEFISPTRKKSHCRKPKIALLQCQV